VYEEGPLAYEDFKGEILETDNSFGSIYLDLLIIDSSFYISDTKMNIPIARAVVLIEQSWLNYDKGADLFLDYFQVLYDIQHLYALKINRLSLDKLGDLHESEIKLLYNEMNIVSEKMRSESDYGQRAETIEKWSQKIASEIQLINTGPPNYSFDSDLGMDGNIGLGYNFKTSDLKMAYGNNLGISMGFNFNIKSYYLIFAGSLGWRKLPETLNENPNWPANIHRNDVVFNLAVGKKFNYKKIKITPFLGAGLTNLYINKSDYGSIYPSVSTTDWNIGGGLIIDYPIKKKYDYEYGWARASKIYTEHGFRFMINTSGNTSIYNKKGLVLAVSVNYYFYMGNLIIK
jgi:hypothetical protein